MCPPVKWGWCLKSFKRRYTFFIFFMFKMNSLMVSEYFDNGSVHKKKQTLNLMLLQVQQHLEYCICFMIKSLFLQKRPGEG